MGNEEKSHLKICILGAGISGMCTGIKLQSELNIHDYTIFDENHDVGGTWLTHTYPGCACDVASHLYSFSFELNPNWTTTYARQPEILAYLQGVAMKHDLYSKIKFHHQVKSCTWDEKIYKWRIVVTDKEDGKTSELIYDILVSGVGGLRVPNIPEEFTAFKGPIIHSARWNHQVALEDKVIAVIGSGCSAVQIVPEIVDKVKRLLSFQRRPAWVPPMTFIKFPEIARAIFSRIPFLLWLYRVLIFFSHEIKYPFFKAHTKLRMIAKWLISLHMRWQIPTNAALRKKLKPNYEFGCKRVSPSNRYLSSLDSPHCEVITDKIVAVNDHAIITDDGKEHTIDVLILSTGYKVQDFFAPLRIVGINSEDILETWKAYSPIHYLGIATSSAPNAFVLLGPNTASGHNSVIFTIECQVNWTMQVLREMIKRRAKMTMVKKEAEKKFMSSLRERMKQTVWGNFECGSWYANHLGINTTLYPGSLIAYWNESRKPVMSDLEFL